MPDDLPEVVAGADERRTSGIMRDMFVDRWGFGEPAEGYRAQYNRDLATLQWLQSLDAPIIASVARQGE